MIRCKSPKAFWREDRLNPGPREERSVTKEEVGKMPKNLRMIDGEVRNLKGISTTTKIGTLKKKANRTLETKVSLTQAINIMQSIKKKQYQGLTTLGTHKHQMCRADGGGTYL